MVVALRATSRLLTAPMVAPLHATSQSCAIAWCLSKWSLTSVHSTMPLYPPEPSHHWRQTILLDSPTTLVGCDLARRPKSSRPPVVLSPLLPPPTTEPQRIVHKIGDLLLRPSSRPGLGTIWILSILLCPPGGRPLLSRFGRLVGSSVQARRAIGSACFGTDPLPLSHASCC